MGNSSNNKGQPLRFQQLGIDEHQLLSTLLVVKQIHSQEKFMVKQINIANEAEYSRILRELKQRKMLSDKKLGKYLVRLRDVEGKEQSQICGKSFKLLLYLEYLSGSLKTVFIQRLRSNRPFEEEQLLQILKSVVHGLIVLHDNNFKNMHLSKEAIVITSENTYKMIDTQLCNRVHPYFQILNGVPPKSGTYMAPQLLADIRKGSSQFYHSPKADLFSFAVLLLQLSTLNMMDKYYDYESKRVDTEGLRSVAQNLPMSGFFRDKLLSMLADSEDDRIGLLSMKQTLFAGNQTLQNEDLHAYQSICQPDSSNPRQSSRTYLTRNKNVQSVQRTSGSNQRVQSTGQKTGDKVIQMPVATHQISQYITNAQTRQNRIQVPRSSRPPINSPTYMPIDIQKVFVAERQPQNTQNNRINQPTNRVNQQIVRINQPTNRVHQQTVRINQPTNRVNQTIQQRNRSNQRPISIPVSFHNRQQQVHQSLPPNWSTSEQRESRPIEQKVNIVQPMVQEPRHQPIAARITESVHLNEPMRPPQPRRESFRNTAEYFKKQTQTPRNQNFHNVKRIDTRQFDTPVSMLDQTQPSTLAISTPVNRVQNINPIRPTSYQSQAPLTKTEGFKSRKYGHLDFQNEARYEGEFNIEGKFQGNGILYYPSGKVCYSGSWKDNSFHGFGVLHHENPSESKEETPYWHFNLPEINWLYYEGEFSMDHKEGFGTLHMANGDKFSGCFKNDSVQGFGTFYLRKQQKNINGIWINNELKQ